MAKRIRLHKYIANCGYTSRRRAELLIQAARVKVNGKQISTLGATIDTTKDKVSVNGDEIRPPERVTLMLHKQSGIITSTHDTHDRLTVMDILPRRFRDTGVFPVGRLDQGTEGLLVLTNDGDLHHQVAHPRHETEKEYDAEVKGAPTRDAYRRFSEGILLDGKHTAPAEVISVTPTGRTTVVKVVIKEGRKRQVRRMFETLGHPVVHLIRRRVGDLELGELSSGEWRELTAEEIDLLAGRRGSA